MPVHTGRGRNVAPLDRPPATARAAMPEPPPATPLRARTVVARRQSSVSTQRTQLLEPWSLASPPSFGDLQRLHRRARALEALYASASPSLVARFAARVPSLPGLAAMAPAQQDCALRLHALERQALWSGAGRESLVPAYAEAGRPLRTGPRNPTERTLELRTREALMRALASLMTPGQRTAALDHVCDRPWPGLGDAKAAASRDLLRRASWSLFDLMAPEELAQATRKLTNLKKDAPGDAAWADRILLLGHALAQSRAWRASRAARPDDDFCRERLVAHYTSRPEVCASEFDSACDPAPLLGLEREALEPTLQWRALQIEVLTRLMSPERRLVSLVHANRQHVEATESRTPTRQDADAHGVRQRLMQERLRALFSAMTPAEIEAAKKYLYSLARDNASAAIRPASPSLREQKAQGSFLNLCDEALQAVLRPVRER